MQDILDFEKQYKGSDEEVEDLKRLYLQHEGDMDLIMESALCCTHEDEPRVKDILQKAIDDEEVPAYKAFTHESAKKKNIRKRKVLIHFLKFCYEIIFLIRFESLTNYPDILGRKREQGGRGNAEGDGLEQ